MGYDYSSMHVFAGTADLTSVRSHVIDRICAFIPCGTTKEEATRSVVVGPPDRWIFVGDSASATDGGDPAALESLAKELSTIGPTLVIHMSDSACVHMYLHHQRELIDKFGTGKFPFFPFDSEDEAASFRGIEQRWKPFALNADGPAQLRFIWDTKHNADGIVVSIANTLGIHPALAGCGFTIFDEANEIHYRDWLEGDPVLSKRFDEFHFGTSRSGG